MEATLNLIKLPNAFFDTKNAKNKIQGLNLNHEKDFNSQINFEFSSSFKTSDICLIQATGALIKYLEQQCDCESDSKMAYPIIGLNKINIALQIFKREFRTNATKNNKIITKEGLSLFGLLFLK
ncbi:hypothetical protein HZS_2355 [Henneguya salminicola]|nr:hypothetical protein HZS_2355 [Henneguya salminicola]